MVQINIILQPIQTFFTLVNGALRLDPATFRTVQMNASTTGSTTGIVILAGISLALGQSVVLFANKVKPLHFIGSLVCNTAIFAVNVLLWVATFQLVALLFFRVEPSFFETARIVGVAFAPLLFGFFVLLPYLGTFLEHVLYAWSTLAMLVAISTTTHLYFWEAVVSALVTWALTQAIRYTIGKPLVTLESWLRQTAAGMPLSEHVQELTRVVTGSLTQDHDKGDKP